MKFQVWPYFKYEGKWSIPDEVLFYFWNEFEKSGNAKQFFYDGEVKELDDFIYFMQDRNNFPVFAVDADTKKIPAFGMINNLREQIAYAHFGFLDGFKRGCGETVIDYWRDLKRDDGKNLVEILIGITPESYEVVLKIIELWGFKIIGKIPKICSMHYQDRKEAGVISYLDLQED
jgi:hypothetical protein